MYRALYRKWRPRIFADVVGQEAITGALANQIESGRVGHAYLFTGSRGTGKTTCAKIFANAVNCENPNGPEPCGECAVCVGVENGSILDVVEIDAASNNSVDDVRDLREEAVYHPSHCKYKAYIIDEVHMLSGAAFNALLKIMEEPPAHVLFILATTEIHKVPATILSRCQRFDFMRIPAEKISGRLMEVAEAEKIALTPEASDLIARLADGALRDALSLLDTCASLGEDVDEALVRRMAGVVDKSYLFAISDAVDEEDFASVLEQLNSLHNQSIDVKRLTEELVSHYRTLMLATASMDGALLERLQPSESAHYAKKASALKRTRPMTAIRRLAQAMDRISRATDPAVELELALYDLASAGHEPEKSQPSVMKPVPAAVSPPVAPAVKPELPAPSLVPNAALPASKKKAADTLEPEEEEHPPEPFTYWTEVLKKMAETDPMLHSFMNNTKAYSDGKRVLIDGGDVFLTYIRQEKAATEKIKQAIADVVGRRYGIGPYKPADNSVRVTAQDTLNVLKSRGVPVEYDVEE